MSSDIAQIRVVDAELRLIGTSLSQRDRRGRRDPPFSDRPEAITSRSVALISAARPLRLLMDWSSRERRTRSRRYEADLNCNTTSR